MRSTVKAIMFLAVMLLATLLVSVFSLISDGLTTGKQPSPEGSGLDIVHVSIDGVTSRAANEVVVEVRGGDSPVRINGTLVSISGDSGSQDFTLEG